ncbi:MAG: protein-export chaperone SecB [Rhodobacteraceae bacterium]|nr:protein-export chaperone SecB [Paracoccaceae bacterium]MAY45730.1 protein-export chaperone SecB [Paracoccaceae bacterium]QEW22879.1 Protein-export protein SecB [Marinibacterium anthonyi]
MTDNPDPQGAAPQQPQVQMRVLGQFIRDMSFENVMAQKGGRSDGQPDINVQVNLDAKKRSAEHQYEVAIKLTITSKAKDSGDSLFLMEIDYAGIFHIDGIPDEQMHPFLMIECPRILFPFLRRIVSDVTRDGGYPPLNLDNIDFVALYRQEIMRRQAVAQAQAAEAPTQ